MKKIILIICLFFSTSTFSDDTFTFIVKKEKAKKESRWSLQSWLETRDRMMLMDLWLSMNSPSPYEFYLGADYSFSASNTRFHLGGFATIFGLEFEHETKNSRLSGLFRLRAFGVNDQNTNLTLEGGLRQESFYSTTQNPFVSGSLTFYFARFFGVSGKYRYFFNSATSEDGFLSYGKRFELGPFIDFSFVRIYGHYFNEKTTRSQNSLKITYPSSGLNLGLRMYF